MFLPFNYVSTPKSWQMSLCLLCEACAPVDAVLLPYEVMCSSGKTPCSAPDLGFLPLFTRKSGFTTSR